MCVYIHACACAHTTQEDNDAESELETEELARRGLVEMFVCAIETLKESGSLTSFEASFSPLPEGYKFVKQKMDDEGWDNDKTIEELAAMKDKVYDVSMYVCMYLCMYVCVLYVSI